MSITEETRRTAYYEAENLAITRRKIIYIALRKYGPQTVDELMDRLGYTDPNQIRPRLTELKKDGLVEACGKRLNRAGTLNIAVWQVAEVKNVAADAANTDDDCTKEL